MFKRRIHRAVEPKFPYGKSLVASCGLLVATMLILYAAADPKSGEIPPRFAWLTLAGWGASIVAVFYAEFRLRNKRQPIGSGLPNQGDQVKRHWPKESKASSKC